MKAITLYYVNTEENHTFLVWSDTYVKAEQSVIDRGYTPLGGDTVVMFQNEPHDIESIFL